MSSNSRMAAEYWRAFFRTLRATASTSSMESKSVSSPPARKRSSIVPWSETLGGEAGIAPATGAPRRAALPPAATAPSPNLIRDRSVV